MIRELLLGGAGGVLGFLIYQGYNVYPALFLLGALLVFSQAPGFKGLIGRKAAIGAAPGTLQITFGDIGGQATAKRELVEALNFVAKHEEVKKYGIKPLKGILLTGPPGTGKTLLAKASASYCESGFLAASGSEFIEMYAGVGAQRVRDLFKKARELARSQKRSSALIFIDEIEVLGGKRGKHQSHMEYDQTLNQLLVEMDGINPDEDVKVLVVGATNRSDLMDPALLRPGRFDRIVNVDLPDREGRLAILQLHIRGKPVDPELDLDLVARDTFGFSGAHLESLCNEAAILAMREDSPIIRQNHLVEAIDKVILGERLDRRPNPSERERVAVHEAGHALIGEIANPGSVASITVSPRGNALGYVRQSPGTDRYLYTRRAIEDQICGLLAGAVAEEIVLGDRSTGASNDFSRATELAKKIVYSGLSDLGVVDEDLIGQSEVNAEVGKLIKEQQERCRCLLEEKVEALKETAKILGEREVISGEEFRVITGEPIRAA